MNRSSNLIGTKYAMLVVGSALLAGCSATYEQAPTSSPDGGLADRLERGGAVAIAVPADGAYGSEQYPRSGQFTAEAFASAFRPYTDTVTVIDNCQSLECIRRLDAGGQYDYVVVPAIMRWEDRATEWTGKPDQVRIGVTVFEAGSGKPLASTEMAGKSQWATLGGDHPQDLLEEPVSAFVRSLY